MSPVLTGPLTVAIRVASAAPTLDVASVATPVLVETEEAATVMDEPWMMATAPPPSSLPRRLVRTSLRPSLLPTRYDWPPALHVSPATAGPVKAKTTPASATPA